MIEGYFARFNRVRDFIDDTVAFATQSTVTSRLCLGGDATCLKFDPVTPRSVPGQNALP